MALAVNVAEELTFSIVNTSPIFRSSEDQVEWEQEKENLRRARYRRARFQADPSDPRVFPRVMEDALRGPVTHFFADWHPGRVTRRLLSFRGMWLCSDAEIDAFLTTPQGQQIADMMRYTAVGTPEEVRRFLEEFAASVQADELIVAHHAQDITSRLRSVELTAAVMGIAMQGADA